MATTAATTTKAPTSPESTLPQSTTPTPTVTPSSTPDTTTPQGSGSFTYTSNDQSVVSVNASGVIEAKGNGSTTVTVSYPGLGSKTVNVEVRTKVKSVNLKYNGKEYTHQPQYLPSDDNTRIFVNSGLDEKTIKIVPVFKSGNTQHDVSRIYQTGNWDTIRLNAIALDDSISYDINPSNNELTITLKPLASFNRQIQFQHSSNDCGTITTQINLLCTSTVSSFSVSPTNVLLFTNDTDKDSVEITTQFN